MTPYDRTILRDMISFILSIYSLCVTIISLYGGRLKRGKSRDFEKNCFHKIKLFTIYSTILNTHSKCIFACSASLLRAQSRVLNAVFDLFDFFNFVIHFWI